MKRSARIVLGFIFSSMFILTTFQNCSQPGSINVTDPFKAQREAEAERLAMGADDEMVTVGLNQVPDLKMFFVVDNSGTMQKNQFNLSESFGSMFAPGSAGSLSKFDATTYILNTAQKSPSYSTEKATLEKIWNEQKNYKPDMQMAMNQFTLLARDASYNYGYLPGDNIGYQVKVGSNPVKYDYVPSVVLGTQVDASNNVSLKSSIRKLASEGSVVMEDEFKKRLAILNADRIPLVQDGASYKPVHANVVDSESGLCAVARVLRNPEGYFKSGEMVSFTIVSDENDNDPRGLNCIQSVTEFTGAEDVVDGECRQRESSISYQTTSVVPGTNVCKLNGYNGYNFRFNYVKNNITTDITYKTIKTPAQYSANYSNITYQVIKTAAQYKANYSNITYRVVKTPAQYKAPYTELTYKANQYSYQYLYTNITYYTESCYDVISDGLVVGKKCNVVTPAVTGSKEGNYVTDCYALAKSLNGKAVNTEGYKPVCTTAYKNVGSCNTSDVNCKQNNTLVDKKAPALILGLLNATACLDRAKTYADYAANTTPVCKDASKTVSVCTAEENAAGCVKATDIVYENKTVPSVLGSFTPEQCLAKAQTYSDYAAGATPTCVLNQKTVTTCSSAENAAGCTLSADAVLGDKTASAVGHFNTASSCLDRAKTFSDYVSSSKAPTCVQSNKTVSSCSSTETAAGCTLSSAAVYGTESVSAPGDLATGSGCFNYAKTLNGNAVTVASDVTVCRKVETPKNLTYDGTLSFTEVPRTVDNGVLLAVNADCGVVKSLALAKGQKSVAQLTVNDKCTITAVNKASETLENFVSDCSVQADNRCNSQNLRGCVGTYVPGTASNTNSSVTLFKKVTEDVRCTSKCNSSKMDICEADKASDMTVAQYLKKKFGDSAVCSESVKEVSGSGVAKTAVLASEQANVCQPNMQGVPSYFVITKTAYRTKSTQVDYVAGTVQDSAGQRVPKSSLVDFIKERSQALSNGSMVFSALVRTSKDDLGYGGTYGVDYEKLISETKGQLGSVLSNDYSLILKDLSAVLKSSIERTFILKKMKPHQVIKKVSQLVKSTGQLVTIDARDWNQNGATIILSNTLEVNDGDQFKVEFANY